MLLFLIILSLICLGGLHFSRFYNGYLDRTETSSIKGIFAIMILLSHIQGGGTFSANPDLGVKILLAFGQMIVVMYFFYSGYGIMTQYSNKGKEYFRSFPRRRILKTLLHFDAAVVLFILLQFIIGNRFSISDYLLSLIGWTSVGNSNWFVFDILVLYLLTWAAFQICSRFRFHDQSLCILITLMTIVLWAFLYSYKGNQEWWMNTVIAFPLGFWYAKSKTHIDSFLNNHSFIAFIPIIIWILWRFFVGIDIVGIAAVLFAFGVVGLTTKFSLDNKILRWLGTNCFEIYILQRLPMILLSTFFAGLNDYLFSIIVIVATLALVIAFKPLEKSIDRLLAVSK